MLAPSPLPYKTAEELGLIPGFYIGLLKTLELLKSGNISRVPITLYRTNYSQYFKRIGNDDKPAFNMAATSTHCGTVHCIQGWAQYFYPGSILVLNYSKKHIDAFQHLVMPPGYQYGRHEIWEAIIAIETYLQTGWPEWPIDRSREKEGE